MSELSTCTLVNIFTMNGDLYNANNVAKHGDFQGSAIIKDAGYRAHPCCLLKALTGSDRTRAAPESRIV